MLAELFTELERVEFREAVFEVGTVSVLESSDILSSKLGTARMVEFIRERDCLGDLGDSGAESSDLPLSPLTDARDMTTVDCIFGNLREGRTGRTGGPVNHRSCERKSLCKLDRPLGTEIARLLYRDRRVRQEGLSCSMSMLAPNRLKRRYGVRRQREYGKEKQCNGRTSRTAYWLWEKVRHRNRYLDMHSRPPRARLR